MIAPKLRFKEFDGNWDTYALEDQIDFLAGYAFDSKLMSNDIKNYQLIKMSNVYQNQLDLTRNSSYWEKTDKKTEKFLLKKGDIVLTLTGTVGKTDYGYNVEIKENDKFLLNQRLVRLRGKIDFSLSKFVQYRISTDKFFYHFFNSSKGGTGNQSNVSIEDLKLLELPFPLKAEQIQIATFLSAVDEKISQLSQKLHLLGQYKQGMMQKLFSQQLRFKADDSSEFGEWISSKFDDVLSTVSIRNNQIQANQIQETGKIPVIDQGQKYIAGYTDEVSKVLNSSNAFIIFGDHTTFLKYVDFPFVIGADGVKVLTVKTENFIKYIFYYLVFNNIQPEGYKRHFSIFREIEILLPCLEEQTKIANFLSSIDKKIDVVSEQLEQAKLWKKGLLQQMFV